MSNIALIDWRLVGFGTLWIVGLSVVLAALSFGDYVAAQQRVRLRAVLVWPEYHAAISAGLVLFCLGLIGSSRAWWEQLLWAALAIAFSYQAWHAWGQRARPQP